MCLWLQVILVVGRNFHLTWEAVQWRGLLMFQRFEIINSQRFFMFLAWLDIDLMFGYKSNYVASLQLLWKSTNISFSVWHTCVLTCLYFPIVQDAGPMAHPVRPHSYIKVLKYLPYLLAFSLSFHFLISSQKFLLLSCVNFFPLSPLTDGQLLHRQVFVISNRNVSWVHGSVSSCYIYIWYPLLMFECVVFLHYLVVYESDMGLSTTAVTVRPSNLHLHLFLFCFCFSLTRHLIFPVFFLVLLFSFSQVYEKVWIS